MVYFYYIPNVDEWGDSGLIWVAVTSEAYPKKFWSRGFKNFFVWTGKFRRGFGNFFLKNSSKLKNFSQEGPPKPFLSEYAPAVTSAGAGF